MTRYRSQQEWIHQPSMIRYLIILVLSFELRFRLLKSSMESMFPWRHGRLGEADRSGPRVLATPFATTFVPCHRWVIVEIFGRVWKRWGGGFPNHQQGFSTFNISVRASWWIWSLARKIDTAGRIFWGHGLVLPNSPIGWLGADFKP